MGFLRIVFLVYLILANFAQAQQQPKTEASIDGFLGPVRSVSSHVEMSGAKWEQPGGPGLMFPILCRDCSYDPDGTRTRSGQFTEDGKFIGEDIALVRDFGGKVIERTFTEVLTGETSRHEWLGPFGPTETDWLQNLTPIRRQTSSYDGQGRLAQRLSFDAEGNQVEEFEIRTAEDGTMLDQSVRGTDGQLTWRQTYDPRTDFQSFETFDATGAVKLAFTFVQGKVGSFWAESDQSNQFGSSFSTNRGNGDCERYSCRADGSCDIAHIHYEFLDSAKRMPRSAEWRDSDGKLFYAAYYEYELDSQQNWVKRTIQIRTPEVPERTLYETDTRTITYWNQ